MYIFVAERHPGLGSMTGVSGATHMIWIDPHATVGLLKEIVQEKTGISPDRQRLLYAGKQLDIDTLRISDFHIKRDSTIHLIRRVYSPSNGILPPSDSAHSPPDKVEARIEAWKSKARQGDFDDDLYIVDPQTHYSKLDFLEGHVVRASEFFRCHGRYELVDNELTTGALDNKLVGVPDDIWTYLNPIPVARSSSGGPNISEIESQKQQSFIKLRKTYMMVCRILDSFDRLSASGFCTSFYSLLVEYPEKDLAEVVRVPRSLINDVKVGIEIVITTICYLDEDSFSSLLSDRVAVPCSTILQRLGIQSSGFSSESTASFLELCRMTAIILDLALVSYVGSHGCRFDLVYLHTDVRNIVVHSDFDFSFKCTLEPLACLDGFLDRKKIWVFHFDTKKPSQNPTSSTRSRRLSILTHMDDFADLWGPVWPVSAGVGFPGLIRRYNVSKGVICRVSSQKGSTVQNAVRCHWYSWASFYRQQVSNLFSSSEDLYLAPDDLLLIGTRLRENDECVYGLNDFEIGYGNPMGDLGTKPSSWKLETRGLALSLTKIVGIQMQGTQKKIPETTLKQHISDKWKNNPTRANPGVLNQFLGIEISHCTGNARRVMMKDLLLTKSIRPLLERQVPGWTTTPWGSAFLRALRDRYDEAIYEVWTKHSRNRAQMAELVCCVLELLETTGTRDGTFTAAFLNDNREQSVQLNLANNDWAIFLQDSHLMAAYAVINEVCLECETPDHSTAICDDARAYTVLQTDIAIPTGARFDRVKVEPNGQIFRKVDEETSNTVLMTPESSVFRGLFSMRGIHSSPVTGYELRDQIARYGFRSRVYLRASKTSYGGLDSSRKRVSRDTPQQEPRSLNNRNLPSLSIRELHPLNNRHPVSHRKKETTGSMRPPDSQAERVLDQRISGVEEEPQRHVEKITNQPDECEIEPRRRQQSNNGRDRQPSNLDHYELDERDGDAKDPHQNSYTDGNFFSRFRMPRRLRRYPPFGP